MVNFIADNAGGELSLRERNEWVVNSSLQGYYEYHVGFTL